MYSIYIISEVSLLRKLTCVNTIVNNIPLHAPIIEAILNSINLTNITVINPKSEYKGGFFYLDIKNSLSLIDFVIEKTRKFYWNKFIELVYSTYPIISQEKGSSLNLIELAREYKNIKNKV